jgi:serine/threonine protein kinase
MARLARDPKDIRDHANTAIPDALANVLMRALEIDPPKRFSDASQMGDALEAVDLS